MLLHSFLCSCTATAFLTYSVGNFDLISLSQPTIILTINTTVAGNQLVTAQDSSTTYSITSNGQSRKIYGSYAPLLAGQTLQANLTAPTGAVSLGNVALSSQPVALVSSIANISEQNLPITYSFTTSPALAPATHEVTITYTVAP